MSVRIYTACSWVALGPTLVHWFNSEGHPGKEKSFPAPWELTKLLPLRFSHTALPGLATTCETSPSVLTERLSPRAVKCSILFCSNYVLDLGRCFRATSLCSQCLRKPAKGQRWTKSGEKRAKPWLVLLLKWRRIAPLKPSHVRGGNDVATAASGERELLLVAIIMCLSPR